MEKFNYFFFLLAFGLLMSCNNAENTTAEATAKIDKKETPKATTVTEKSTQKGYSVGDMATDFSLKNIDDKMVSLADYADAKGFIVTFTCNHCPYSVAYEDRLVALDKKYKSLGYPVIAINPNNPESYPDDSFANMKIRAKDKSFTFPYLFDDGQKIFPQYGATKTPHMYILQKTADGNSVEYIGAIDDNTNDADAVTKRYVEDAVDALLKGEKPEVTKTKAIGCSIKV